MAPPTDPAAGPTARAEALAVLGLPETATGPQIIHAYRRLVRATHPDVTGRTDSAAAQRFTAIHDAYRLLTQPDDDQVADPVQLSPTGLAGDESAVTPDRPSPPTTRDQVFPTCPPIVAGPVTVTPLPEQHRPHPRRSR
jgi:hypothetical protein